MNPSQVVTHDPDTPIFFRNFVDAMIRLFFMKYKFNLSLAAKNLEICINNHIKMMIEEKKVPKHILPDENVFEEKLELFRQERCDLENRLMLTRLQYLQTGKYLSFMHIYRLLKVYSSSNFRFKVMT